MLIESGGYKYLSADKYVSVISVIKQRLIGTK